MRLREILFVYNIRVLFCVCLLIILNDDGHIFLFQLLSPSHAGSFSRNTRSIFYRFSELFFLQAGKHTTHTEEIFSQKFLCFKIVRLQFFPFLLPDLAFLYPISLFSFPPCAQFIYTFYEEQFSIQILIFFIPKKQNWVIRKFFVR